MVAHEVLQVVSVAPLAACVVFALCLVPGLQWATLCVSLSACLHLGGATGLYAAVGTVPGYLFGGLLAAARVRSCDDGSDAVPPCDPACAMRLVVTSAVACIASVLLWAAWGPGAAPRIGNAVAAHRAWILWVLVFWALCGPVRAPVSFDGPRAVRCAVLKHWGITVACGAGAGLLGVFAVSVAETSGTPVWRLLLPLLFGLFAAAPPADPLPPPVAGERWVRPVALGLTLGAGAVSLQAPTPGLATLYARELGAGLGRSARLTTVLAARAAFLSLACLSLLDGGRLPLLALTAPAAWGLGYRAATAAGGLLLAVAALVALCAWRAEALARWGERWRPRRRTVIVTVSAVLVLAVSRTGLPGCMLLFAALCTSHISTVLRAEYRARHLAILLPLAVRASFGAALVPFL